MTELNNTRVAIYLRTSPTETTDINELLKSQEIICRDYCARQGYSSDIRVYIDVVNRASTIEERPGLTLLVEDARDMQFDVVVVPNTNYPAFRLQLLVAVMDELGRYNIKFRFVNERFTARTVSKKTNFELFGISSGFEANVASD